MKYRIKEVIVIHWHVPIGDFSSQAGHMEYHVQKRYMWIFYKTIAKCRDLFNAISKLEQLGISNYTLIS